jgi:3-keto-disaccharide hydrolase
MITKRILLQLVFTCVGFGVPVTVLAAEQQGLGYKDTPLVPGTEWHVHDGDRPQPRIVTPAATFSHLAPAPSDAVVLFDGKDLSKWEVGPDREAKWKVENGYIEVTPKSGSIRTKDKFADFQLHLEFATPAEVKGNGQGRGNSGILFNGLYEVQVLDSYGNKTYPDGQAGALYGYSPPLVNASKPPGEWQSYDIRLVGRTVTVVHNGIKVIDKAEVEGLTAIANNADEAEPGPFIVQGDHSYVEIKSFVVTPLVK